ncbi:MAG: hypothetical protein RLZ83_444, partial [Pseudomonadota bacterium]
MNVKSNPALGRLGKWWVTAAMALAAGSAAAQPLPANTPAPVRLEAGSVVV